MASAKDGSTVGRQQAAGVTPGSAAPGTGAARLLDLHLPAGLPVLPRVRTAACYRSAGRAAGGWFDAVPLAGGAVALMVGGVVGHGLAAAAAMGQLRAVVDELLAAEDDLATVLARADRFASSRPELRAATLVLAVLDPGDGTLRYASCGHPPPLVVSAGGTARALPSSGGGPLATGSVPGLASDQLRPGDLLLLHGAGEILAGEILAGKIVAGEIVAGESMAGVSRRSGLNLDQTRTVDQVCQQAASRLAAGSGPADVVTLAAQWRPAAEPGLTVELPAIPGSLRAARHSFTGWLSELDPLVQDGDTLQLAIGEVVGNAVEHAYPPGQPGRIRLEAALGDDGQVECRISDRGSWKVPDPASQGRGAGLMLVGRMVDRLEVQHPPQPPGRPPGARGTVVILRHRLSRPAVLTSAASPNQAVRPAGPAFEVDTGADGTGVWATVRGPVDASTAVSFGSQLLIACRGGTLPLSVDLTEVTELSSAGVRALYQVKQQLAVYQRALALVAAPGSPADTVLGVAGLPHAMSR